MKPWRFSVPILAAVVFTGCATGRALMPTPNVYDGATEQTIYSEIPATLKSNAVDLLYVTDRKPEIDDQGQLFYGFGRSPSAAFGSAIVEIGEKTPWETLVSLSLAGERKEQLKLEMGAITELGRFPETPYPAVLIEDVIQPDPAAVKQARVTESLLHTEFGRRLALAKKKEAVIFIHGYNNDFEDAAFTLAELWHFLGREHVPILYSWPAGRGGLKGYAYDRESGEFTVFHLKRFLKSVAAAADIDKVHLIAHSRGTDVTMSAIRELFLEATAEGLDVRAHFKIENLVLAAPDMDFEVVLQRIVAENVGTGVGQLTVYTSQKDKAIGIAERLFGSLTRIGRLQPTDFTPAQAESVKRISDVTFVELQGKTDTLGHGYFHNSPAASSDLILVIRYDRPPGAEHGRPMQPKGVNFWVMDEDYPKDRSIPE
ncbi:MAG: alpha/beta hydrolase [Gammaproteobacteria bacterium]|nr:alpha/beta hydrolase [Gammaproteobacteria bacterium]